MRWDVSPILCRSLRQFVITIENWIVLIERDWSQQLKILRRTVADTLTEKRSPYQFFVCQRATKSKSSNSNDGITGIKFQLIWNVIILYIFVAEQKIGNEKFFLGNQFFKTIKYPGNQVMLVLSWVIFCK